MSTFCCCQIAPHPLLNPHNLSGIPDGANAERACKAHPLPTYSCATPNHPSWPSLNITSSMKPLQSPSKRAFSLSRLNSNGDLIRSCMYHPLLSIWKYSYLWIWPLFPSRLQIPWKEGIHFQFTFLSVSPRWLPCLEQLLTQHLSNIKWQRVTWFLLPILMLGSFCGVWMAHFFPFLILFFLFSPYFASIHSFPGLQLLCHFSSSSPVPSVKYCIGVSSPKGVLTVCLGNTQ